MKKTLFLSTFILIGTIVVASSDTSMFKIEDEVWTQDETDHHTYRYKQMELSLHYRTIYVYDIVDYTNSGMSFSANRAHYILCASDGTINEGANSNYSIRYNDIKAGDTLQVVYFEVDSMQGNVIFEEFTFVGSRRSGNVGIIENISTKPLNAYPNPVKNKINLPEIEGIFRYMVYNLSGQAMIGGSSNNKEIDFRFLPSGQYILQIRTEDKTYSSKIIKN